MQYLPSFQAEISAVQATVDATVDLTRGMTHALHMTFDPALSEA